MDANTRILALANRFEAIAAEGFEGRPYEQDLADLVRQLRGEAGIAPRVAQAVALMVSLIRDSDPSGRFAAKTAILEDAAARLSG